ncbi:MAG: hypothetical protein EXX96DRAFT_482014 [Benjaminiella poitrasii]|nr:MAG: hypothetical protein EXX96DRAFT_482014 [Benjaminiella poitrasii]
MDDASTSTTTRFYRKQTTIVVLKWVLTATIFGIITFFTLFGIDFNSRITLKDSLTSPRPDAGPLSSRHCFKQYDYLNSKNQHYGIIPSVPVKEEDVCFNYSSLIRSNRFYANHTSSLFFHTYWSTDMTDHLTDNQLAAIRSFVATQPYQNQLLLWISKKDEANLLKVSSLWHHVKARNVKLKIIEPSLFRHTPLEDVDLDHRHVEETVKLAALYKYGGLWFDLDVLFIRDMTPLFHQEWLSQATCFERSNFASSTTVDSRFSGALMHFRPQSPYVCEMLSVASDELKGVANNLKPLKSLREHLYARVYYRVLGHRITPWAVLPWCFTDPSQCKKSNSLPSLFKNDKHFNKNKLASVFAFHWHKKWNSSPGSIFKYLVNQHKHITVW